MNPPNNHASNSAGEPSPTAHVKDLSIRRRIASLTADIQAAEAKAARLQASIRVRNQTLNRLRFQLTLRGEDDAVRTKHE